ncbi:MAG: alpha/beta hydrolase family protein [Capsulimonadaceae bacterium]
MGVGNRTLLQPLRRPVRRRYGVTVREARTAKLLIVWALGIAALAYMAQSGPGTPGSAAPAPAASTASATSGLGWNLADARRAHPTQLLRLAPAPEAFQLSFPGCDGQAVTYRSDGRVLSAWLIKPNMAGLHPGIVYCHSGYALTPNDVRAVRPFVDAGYVVLLPSYRGENGNEGHFEMYYGEVDDARAALDGLATVPIVDSTRLFAVGKGAGATIAMLLAESGAPIRAAAACSGIADYRQGIQDGPAWPEAPFDWTSPIEVDLRSPARHVNDLNCPLYLYYAEDEDETLATAQTMPNDAAACGKAVTLTVIAHSSLANVARKASQQILTDFSPVYAPTKPVVLDNSQS